MPPVCHRRRKLRCLPEPTGACGRARERPAGSEGEQARSALEMSSKGSAAHYRAGQANELSLRRNRDPHGHLREMTGQ